MKPRSRHQPNNLPMASQCWQDIVARKKLAIDQKMPKEWLLPQAIFQDLDLPLGTNPNDLIAQDIPRRSGLLTLRELDITENYGVTELLKRLRQGAFTALEVTIAFSKRAVIAQQLVRPTTPLPILLDSPLCQYLLNGRPANADSPLWRPRA